MKAQGFDPTIDSRKSLNPKTNCSFLHHLRALNVFTSAITFQHFHDAGPLADASTTKQVVRSRTKLPLAMGASRLTASRGGTGTRQRQLREGG